MGTIRTIAKNTLFYFTGQVVSCVLSFFFFMQAARYLGAGDFGILSTALAIAAIFGAFGDMGLRQIATREIARDKSLAGKYLANVVGIKTILIVIVLAGLVVLVNLLGYPSKTRYAVYLIGLSIVFTAFTQVFYALFQARERMEFESIGNILKNFLFLLCVLAVITTHSSVLVLALLYSLVTLIISGYAVSIYVWKFGGLKIETDLALWKSIFIQAMPFGLTAVFGMINYWISTVILSTMKGDAVVGWYSAAYRIVFVFLLIPSAFDAAVFPVMSRLYMSSHDSLKLMCEKGFKYLTFIGVPVGIGGTLLADKIIPLVFGNEYSNSVIAFRILIWSAVFVFMGTPFSSVLNSTNRQITLAKLVGLSAVCNVLANLLLVPRYGYIGASIASVFSVFVILAGVIIATSRIGGKVQTIKIGKPIVTACGSGLVMGLVIIVFQDMSVVLVTVIAITVYLAAMFAMNGFDAADMAVARIIFLKKDGVPIS